MILSFLHFRNVKNYVQFLILISISKLKKISARKREFRDLISYGLAQMVEFYQSKKLDQCLEVSSWRLILVLISLRVVFIRSGES